MTSKRKPKSVTLRDVANRAGVASSTVSYVLNNGPKTISKETSERVLRAAGELSYSSNLVAKSLATGRMHAIGVIAYQLTGQIASLLLAGIEQAAQEAGYKVLVASHQEDPSRALAALSDMTGWRLDGILTISATANVHPGVVAKMAEITVPHVFAYHEPAVGTPEDCVTVDQAHGGYIATRHLIERGCRRIAFIGGPLDRTVVVGRLAGFRQAHADMGLTVDEDLIGLGKNFAATTGHREMQKILSDAPHPDGVFAASDWLAAGALRACRAVGARVPDDIAIIGFDDHLNDAIDPPLSSIHMPLEDVGRASFERLLARLTDSEQLAPETLRLPCQLVIRESA